MAGVPTSEIQKRTQSAYASQRSRARAGAMAYMLSHEQHLAEKNPHWMPHLMFYFDKSVPASDWGAGAFSAPIIDGSAGTASSPVFTLLIPVASVVRRHTRARPLASDALSE